jgi:hypothetical protein
MNCILSTKIGALVLAAICFLGATPAQSQSAAQRVFDSPEAAADALIAAARTNDQTALVEIFGAKHRDLIGTVDATRDRELRARFAKLAEEYLELYPEPNGSVSLVVGFETWPFPIPLVKEGSGWRFATEAGIDEIINRRIGENELAAIETLRAYVDAQRQYGATPRDGTRVRQFAQKIRSAPGKRDGLYWDADPAKGEELSPAGALIEDAGTRVPGAPYKGYYFKILTRQGVEAPAGRYNYLINGRLIAGFAMIAFPADYGKTGVMSFLVNHYGMVYQKNLGPKTGTIGRGITEYNPDRTWKEVVE